MGGDCPNIDTENIKSYFKNDGSVCPVALKNAYVDTFSVDFSQDSRIYLIITFLRVGTVIMKTVDQTNVPLLIDLN